MPKFLIFLVLFAFSCSASVTPPPPQDAAATETPTLIFGYQGGWGAETYYRLKDGRWYASAYAGLRTNDSENRLNREALASDENNWSLIGPAPAAATALAESLPLTDLRKIEERSSCAALAHDGGCPLVGIYSEQEGEGYVQWYGDFADVPSVAAYMERVDALVRESGY